MSNFSCATHFFESLFRCQSLEPPFLDLQLSRILKLAPGVLISNLGQDGAPAGGRRLIEVDAKLISFYQIVVRYDRFL